MEASVNQLITFEYKNDSLAILWDKIRLEACGLQLVSCTLFLPSSCSQLEAHSS